MNPNPTYYKRTKLDNKRTAFMFDNLDNYNRFITETSKVATGNTRRGLDMRDRQYVENKIRSNRESWYGTTDPNSVTDNLDTYLFLNELESFLNTLRSQTVNIDVTDIDQQKAIKFTDQEIGIFSFDLASLGLIRVYEYFSPLLKKVVNPNFIRSKKLPNGDLVFYHIFVPFVPQHKVEYNTSKGGYYSPILNIVVPKSQLIEVNENEIYLAYPERAEIPEHEVVRQQKKDENGKLVYSSTFKKSFIYMPKVEKTLPRVDIIVAASYDMNINARTQMIYSSMAALAIAEKLSKSGVNFRFIATYPLETTGIRGYFIYPFVILKKEGEPLDKNKMALLVSDARQFRYQQFKGFLNAFFDAGYDSYVNPSSIGNPIYDAKMVKEAYMDYLKAQDNPEDQAAAKNPNSKIIFNGALSMQQAVAQYNSIIQQITKI